MRTSVIFGVVLLTLTSLIVGCEFRVPQETIRAFDPASKAQLVGRGRSPEAGVGTAFSYQGRLLIKMACWSTVPVISSLVI